MSSDRGSLRIQRCPPRSLHDVDTFLLDVQQQGFSQDPEGIVFPGWGRQRTGGVRGEGTAVLDLQLLNSEVSTSVPA